MACLSHITELAQQLEHASEPVDLALVLAVARSELVHFCDDLFYAGALDAARHEAEPSALSFFVALVAGVALQRAPIAAHQPRLVVERAFPGTSSPRKVSPAGARQRRAPRGGADPLPTPGSSASNSTPPAAPGDRPRSLPGRDRTTPPAPQSS